METRGDVAQTSDLSTCAIKVSCAEFVTIAQLMQEDSSSYLQLIEIDDARIRFCHSSSIFFKYIGFVP